VTDLAHRAALLNHLIEQRDGVARLLLTRASSLSLDELRRLKRRHAHLCYRIARLQVKLR